MKLKCLKTELIYYTVRDINQYNRTLYRQQDSEWLWLSSDAPEVQLTDDQIPVKPSDTIYLNVGNLTNLGIKVIIVDKS